jgi:type IV secretion system protein TrbC
LAAPSFHFEKTRKILLTRKFNRLLWILTKLITSHRLLKGVRLMSYRRLVASLPSTIGWLVVIALSDVAHAASSGASGTPLPWEGPLNQVLASFTGPVAKALCILAIVVLGFGFAFSDGGGLRRILGLLLGVSIAVTATSFGVTFFGFDGGAGW